MHDHDDHLLTFEPWPDPSIDGPGREPDSDWSRLAWLPTIGPSSWLIWGTLAAQLRRDARIDWIDHELAAAHGLGHRGTSHNSPLRRSLARLIQFRLLTPTDNAHLVRMSAPNLRQHQLDRLPAWVAHLDPSQPRWAHRQAM